MLSVPGPDLAAVFSPMLSQRTDCPFLAAESVFDQFVDSRYGILRADLHGFDFTVCELSEVSQQPLHVCRQFVPRFASRHTETNKRHSPCQGEGRAAPGL